MDQGDDLDRGPDIVLAILQLVLLANAGFTPEQAKEVELQVRTQYGGMRTRIAKRKKHPTAEQRAKVFKEAMTNATNEQILSDNGISRPTLYRYLKRGGG